MDGVCKEKQHDFRNAIQDLDGWMRALRKEGKLDDQEYQAGLAYLKRIVICSRLDPSFQNGCKIRSDNGTTET